MSAVSQLLDSKLSFGGNVKSGLSNRSIMRAYLTRQGTRNFSKRLLIKLLIVILWAIFARITFTGKNPRNPQNQFYANEPNDNLFTALSTSHFGTFSCVKLTTQPVFLRSFKFNSKQSSNERSSCKNMSIT